MGRCKTANKGGTNSQRGASPFPSSQYGEEGDTVQDLIEEIVAMEEMLSHLSASPRMHFNFGRTSKLPLVWLVSPDHQ